MYIYTCIYIYVRISCMWFLCTCFFFFYTYRYQHVFPHFYIRIHLCTEVYFSIWNVYKICLNSCKICIVYICANISYNIYIYMHVLIYIYNYIYIHIYIYYIHHISHPLLLNYPLLQLQMNLPSFGMNSVQAMSSAVPDHEHQRRATRSAPRHATARGGSVKAKRGDGKFREKFGSFNGEIHLSIWDVPLPDWHGYYMVITIFGDIAWHELTLRSPGVIWYRQQRWTDKLSDVYGDLCADLHARAARMCENSVAFSRRNQPSDHRIVFDRNIEQLEQLVGRWQLFHIVCFYLVCWYLVVSQWPDFHMCFFVLPNRTMLQV